jgi:YihY family inner membrane protein
VLPALIAVALVLASAVRGSHASPAPAATPRAEDEDRSLNADPDHLPEPVGFFKHLVWRLDSVQRAHSAVGFPVAVLKKFGQDRAGHLAALVAYYGFFSLFPLMLAFTSILGFVLTDPDDQERFAAEAADQIPVVGDTIRNSAGELDGSAVAIVVGLALAVWSGMKIVDAMQNALNTVWSVPRVARPNLAEIRLRSIAMLALIGGGLVCSVAASNVAANLDVIPGGGRIAIWSATALVSVGLYLIAFRLLTDADLPWRDVLPGAVFGGVSWWALQTFGSTFIASQQQSSGEAYGQFASIIALFAFLFLASQLSILGAVINAVMARRLWPRSLTSGHLTAADIEAFEQLANSTRQDESYEVILRRASSS